MKKYFALILVGLAVLVNAHADPLPPPQLIFEWRYYGDSYPKSKPVYSDDGMGIVMDHYWYQDLSDPFGFEPYEKVDAAVLTSVTSNLAGPEDPVTHNSIGNYVEFVRTIRNTTPKGQELLGRALSAKKTDWWSYKTVCLSNAVESYIAIRDSVVVNQILAKIQSMTQKKVVLVVRHLDGFTEPTSYQIALQVNGRELEKPIMSDKAAGLRRNVIHYFEESDWNSGCWPFDIDLSTLERELWKAYYELEMQFVRKYYAKKAAEQTKQEISDKAHQLAPKSK